MACAVEAVPRISEADADDEWGEVELPEDAHWDDECSIEAWGWGGVSVMEAVEELHRQAHGGPLRLCHAEPCRRLELQQLERVMR
jgi:hypothetical protein